MKIKIKIKNENENKNIQYLNETTWIDIKYEQNFKHKHDI